MTWTDKVLTQYFHMEYFQSWEHVRPESGGGTSSIIVSLISWEKISLFLVGKGVRILDSIHFMNLVAMFKILYLSRILL